MVVSYRCAETKLQRNILGFANQLGNCFVPTGCDVVAKSGQALFDRTDPSKPSGRRTNAALPMRRWRERIQSRALFGTEVIKGYGRNATLAALPQLASASTLIQSLGF
jgi:hypothetical protein